MYFYLERGVMKKYRRLETIIHKNPYMLTNLVNGQLIRLNNQFNPRNEIIRVEIKSIEFQEAYLAEIEYDVIPIRYKRHKKKK